ncbi:hypothetical protein Airi02_062790 [Actinoallomurus iriomotensis]|uniref:Rhodanese domain-containing protein n=1 Tax=Actinoallomurus iriomotensis TaxID=478107 RepID=A0A9W6S4Y2_9ACTN|nr:hypothetical protein Airi02_062790 [Actinoallomurus iriomotensis]
MSRLGDVSDGRVRVHCGTGYRASIAASILAAAGRAASAERALTETGMTGLHILGGGITAWRAADGPVDRNRPGWDLEVYGFRPVER